MATLLDGYYNRNDAATRYLEARSDDFPERQSLVDRIEKAATVFRRLRLRADSFWYAKSNAFTLLITLAEKVQELGGIDQSALKSALAGFSDNPPADYTLAAREAVNNKRERIIRADHVRRLVGQSVQK